MDERNLLKDINKRFVEERTTFEIHMSFEVSKEARKEITAKFREFVSTLPVSSNDKRRAMGLAPLDDENAERAFVES